MIITQIYILYINFHVLKRTVSGLLYRVFFLSRWDSMFRVVISAESVMNRHSKSWNLVPNLPQCISIRLPIFFSLFLYFYTSIILYFYEYIRYMYNLLYILWSNYSFSRSINYYLYEIERNIELYKNKISWNYVIHAGCNYNYYKLKLYNTHIHSIINIGIGSFVQCTSSRRRRQ